MIPTFWSDRKTAQWTSILRTWGPRCDVLKLFVDRLPDNDTTVIPPRFVDAATGMAADVVQINMVRRGGMCNSMKKEAKGHLYVRVACRHIWEKMWRSWIWVAENDLDKAEWFLKVDDDTFLFPEFLREFIRERNWTATDPHYFGHKLYQHGEEQTLIAGAVAIWSRATLERVAPVYARMDHEYGDRSTFSRGRCVDRDGATEERTTSLCLRTINITAEDMYDEAYRERVLLWPPTDALMKIRKPDSKGWYFKNKPIYVGTAENCCSDRPVAFHNFKVGRQILRFDHLVYGDNTELADLAHNIPKMDALRAKPEAMTKGLIRGYPVSNLAFAREVEYLYRVRQRLAEIGALRVSRGV